MIKNIKNKVRYIINLVNEPKTASQIGVEK